MITTATVQHRLPTPMSPNDGPFLTTIILKYVVRYHAMQYMCICMCMSRSACMYIFIECSCLYDLLYSRNKLGDTCTFINCFVHGVSISKSIGYYCKYSMLTNKHLSHYWIDKAHILVWKNTHDIA